MTVRYLEAIRLALGDALESDPRVFIYGQDVAGAFGGAFKVTKGLGERFPSRVLNSPISEDAMAGIAIGAAIDGMRPVVEYQFGDFASIAFNQLVNNAAAFYWRTQRPCPLVARLPVGGTPGGGPYHCNMPEGWLSHHPGLVVVCPATVADAYFMMRDAISCDDPVIFCEHKYLYYYEKAEFDPASAERLPLGAAAVRRAGTACTLICWSSMVGVCELAAEQLARDYEVDCEVLDLRCVRPLDRSAILASVAKTGRVVIVSEAFPFGGVAAEVQALIAGEAFQHLDAPPRRLCAQDTPVPFQPDLFVAHHPSEERVVEAVLETVSF
jgi:pyruvate/2-oxoglutarate/acetoin dehydrogenase E1 component